MRRHLCITREIRRELECSTTVCRLERETDHSGSSGDLSGWSAGNKWLCGPLLYGNHSRNAALGMSAKPNTSPRSACCFINPIRSSFGAPRSPSWRLSRGMKAGSHFLVHLNQSEDVSLFPIKPLFFTAFGWWRRSVYASNENKHWQGVHSCIIYTKTLTVGWFGLSQWLMAETPD